MLARRLVCTLLATAVACGDPGAPDPLLPRIDAVNGAVHPMLVAGQPFTVTGFALGADSTGRALLVTTSGGRAPAEILAWSDDVVTARLPDDAVTGSLSLARAPGDTLGPLPLFVRVHEPFDPAALAWKEGPAALRPLTGAPIVTLRYPQGATLATVQVLTGGQAASGELTDSTYFGFGGGAGDVSNWVSAPDTLAPGRRRLHAIVAVDRTRTGLESDQFEAAAYLIGGLDTDGLPLASVDGLGVRSSGEYGLWQPFTLLPDRRAGVAALTTHGIIFVAGGFGPDSVARADVFFAIVLPNARLNGWFRGPPLPEPRALGALVVVDETLYYLGGQTGAVSPDSTDPASPNLRGTVWAMRLSPRSGFPSEPGWIEVGQLVRPRSRHAAFGLDGGILVTGGVYLDAPSTGESEFASIASDGTVGAFAIVPVPTIAELGGGALRDMAYATAWDSRGVPHPLIVGGRTGSDTVLARTWWH